MQATLATLPAPSRIMNWLRSRSFDTGGSAREMSEFGGSASLALDDEARQRSLDRISAFIIEHGLEITAANLGAVHGAISGVDHNLARAVDARLKANEKITQEWFDEVTGGDVYSAYREELEGLLNKLEEGIATFTDTTRQAQSATGDYRAALEHHVNALKHPGEGVLIDLAELAKAMLERTRQIEREVRRNENEARALRESLAKARRDADVDHLTGLPNRRAFEALLEIQHAEAKAARDSLIVAFCDIDNFKRVNDTHGHDTGDRVIKAIGDALSNISVHNCHVARHGGEEFVLLFRGKTVDQVMVALDNAREAMSHRRFVNRETEQPIGTITFSGGIADIFAYPTARAALKGADAALYRAKERGRNQICVAETDQASPADEISSHT